MQSNRLMLHRALQYQKVSLIPIQFPKLWLLTAVMLHVHLRVTHRSHRSHQKILRLKNRMGNRRQEQKETTVTHKRGVYQLTNVLAAQNFYPSFERPRTSILSFLSHLPCNFSETIWAYMYARM